MMDWGDFTSPLLWEMQTFGRIVEILVGKLTSGRVSEKKDPKSHLKRGKEKWKDIVAPP